MLRNAWFNWISAGCRFRFLASASFAGLPSTYEVTTESKVQKASGCSNSCVQPTPRAKLDSFLPEELRLRVLDQSKGPMMTHSITVLASAARLATSLSSQASSQGAPQTVTLMKVDPASLATGYRTSKVVGSAVVNQANEPVGTIDDLIVTPSEKVPYAVLSVGGFLGMGSKYVVVPFSSLHVKDKQMVLPGATKDSLKALPAFKYSTGT
jgi:PRC-barrel domain